MANNKTNKKKVPSGRDLIEMLEAPNVKDLVNLIAHKNAWYDEGNRVRQPYVTGTKLPMSDVYGEWGIDELARSAASGKNVFGRKFQEGGKVDYTGASAEELINKFTNRPEDKGSIINKLISSFGDIGSQQTRLEELHPEVQEFIEGIAVMGGLGGGGRGVGKAHDVINKILKRNKLSIQNIKNKINSETLDIPRAMPKSLQKNAWPHSTADWHRRNPYSRVERTTKKDIFGPGETAGISGIAGGAGAAYGMENLMDNPLIGKLVEFMMSDPDTEGSSRMDLYHGMPDLRLEKFK